MMAFPTSNISAANIRTELAGSNTGGAQTPISLNDTAVRAAANKPSGAVSYGDLSGVRVFVSSLTTFGAFLNPSSQATYGYQLNTAGGGSASTLNWYRNPLDVNTGVYGRFYQIAYNQPLNTTTIRALSAGTYTSTPVTTLYVNFDTTRYTFSATSGASSYLWSASGDPFNLIGRNGTTSQVVITY